SSSAGCCTGSPSLTVWCGARSRISIFTRCSPRCMVSARSICRPSISTSARTGCIATRPATRCGGRRPPGSTPPSAAPSPRCPAPILCYPPEGAGPARHGDRPDRSIHLETFAAVPAEWHDAALGARWADLRDLRRVATGALELERGAKRIGSSLQAALDLYV